MNEKGGSGKGQSPTPWTVKKANDGKLDFYSALRMVVGGSKVARKVWPEKVHAALAADGKIVIMLEDGIYHPWTLHVSDIESTDWGILLG